jgi:hypothetical protein
MARKRGEGGIKAKTSEDNYFEDFTGLPLREWLGVKENPKPKSKQQRKKKQRKS